MEPAPQPSELLQAHRWRARPLLLFAPDPQNADYQAQRRLLDDRAAGMTERDLVLFELFTDRGRASGAEVEAERVAGLRREFDIPPDAFTLLLVGKDGTVKRRAAAPVEPEILFDQIDGMPMRRSEMRERTDR